MLKYGAMGEQKIIKKALVIKVAEQALLNCKRENSDVVPPKEEMKQIYLNQNCGDKWDFLLPYMNTDSPTQSVEPTMLNKSLNQHDTRDYFSPTDEMHTLLNLPFPNFYRKKACKNASITILVLFLAYGLFSLDPVNKLKRFISLPAQLETVRATGSLDAQEIKTEIERNTALESHVSIKSKDATEDLLLQQRTIVGLLTKAKRQFELNNLTSPIGDSALDMYQEVLLVKPDHREAWEGIQNIKSRYVEWAKAAKNENNIDKATEYYRNAIAIVRNDQLRLQGLRRIREEQVSLYSKLVRQRVSGGAETAPSQY